MTVLDVAQGARRVLLRTTHAPSRLNENPMRVPKILITSFPRILVTRGSPTGQKIVGNSSSGERKHRDAQPARDQVIRPEGHTWAQVPDLAGMSVGTARRVVSEDGVTTVENAAKRARRQIGRPSTADAYREVLVQALTEQPALKRSSS